ncbi:Nop14-like family protein, partial [Helicosporidium sp. ATCC 50920]
MAKAKGGKRKAFRGRRAAPEAPENPFERLSNKKRFDILGRKVKGETRETGKLRSAAAEKRKNTLLVEYKQLRKANAFVDRRFGENDKTMTEEEKSLLRLQKQRLFDVAGGKFALPEEEDPRHVLTHGGRSLADQDWGAYGGGDFEGDDEAWADAADPALSFGGGLFERAEPRLERATEGGEEDGLATASQPAKKRSHAEIMAEVVGKAKAFKAARQQQRDDDAAEAEALDEAFSSLAAQGALKNLTVAKGE